MNVWYITIWDGHNEIGHHFINDSLSPQDVFIHCLNTFYGPDSPYDIFRKVERGDFMNLNAEADESYNIYCTNMIPDISFERKEIITPEIGEVLFTNIIDADILLEGKQ